jgi:hypothetical protein
MVPGLRLALAGKFKGEPRCLAQRGFSVLHIVSKLEVMTGVARRRRFPTELKLALVAETMQPGMSVG